jgi:hypothetical protein
MSRPVGPVTDRVFLDSIEHASIVKQWIMLRRFSVQADNATATVPQCSHTHLLLRWFVQNTTFKVRNKLMAFSGFIIAYMCCVNGTLPPTNTGHKL